MEKFELAVQELLETNQCIRDAENGGNEDAVRKLLKDGLIKSCELLRFMVSDSLMNSAQPNPIAWRSFRNLAKLGALEGFFDSERQVLRKLTDLKPDIVEVIIGALRQAIQAMIDNQGRIDASWVVMLNNIADSVCQRAASPEPQPDWKRYFKRGCLAGVGGLIAVVNLLAMSSPDLQAMKGILQLSVDGGTWLIGWAGAGQLDDWFGSKGAASAGSAS